MDGVLIIDKPQGVTSHDVVAAARRLLGERRIGHTGTLDPLATGVLPLALGRATRLVRFLVASDKEYDATIRFGLTTDSYDVTGAETSRTGAVPSRDEVLAALRKLTGEYLQTPPAFSAKKVEGRRAYALARRDQAVTLAPTPVRVDRAELVGFENDRARVAVTCSAGFYVRAFAHAVGELVGTGACLEALRRTRAGEFDLRAAVRLDELQEADRAASRVLPISALLRSYPAVTLTPRGRELAAHGREVEPGDYDVLPSDPATASSFGRRPATTWIRLIDPDGGLVALATPGRQSGSLHPSLVLV